MPHACGGSIHQEPSGGFVVGGVPISKPTPFWLCQVCSWSGLALSICRWIRRTCCGPGCSPPFNLSLRRRCNEPGSANLQPEAGPPSQLNQVNSSQNSTKRRMDSSRINVLLFEVMKFGDRWLCSKTVATFLIKKESAVSSGLHFLTESFCAYKYCIILKKRSILFFFKLPVWSSSVQFSSAQSLSRVWLFATPWTTAHQASLSITNSWSLLKLISIECLVQGALFILFAWFYLS